MTTRHRRRAARAARHTVRLTALAAVSLTLGLALWVALAAATVHLLILEPLRGLAHLIGAS